MQASQISCAGAHRQYGTKQDCRIAPYFIGRNRRIIERKASSLRIFAKFCTPKYATYHLRTGVAAFATLVIRACVVLEFPFSSFHNLLYLFPNPKHHSKARTLSQNLNKFLLFGKVYTHFSDKFMRSQMDMVVFPTLESLET